MDLKRREYTRILCKPVLSNAKFIGLISESSPRYSYCIDTNRNVWAYRIEDIISINQKVLVTKRAISGFIEIECDNEKVLDFLRKEIVK